MLIDLAAILGGFIALVWSAERFIAGAAALARNLGISPMLIGLTVVGFGTSAPEILVSGMAAWGGNPGLAVGNAVGSNIANIGLILGITALVQPLDVKSGTLRREYPILLAVTLGALMLVTDQHLGVVDGLILLGGLAVVLYIMYRLGIAGGGEDPLGGDFDSEIPRDMSTQVALGWFFIGLLVLLASSRLLVWGAVNVALSFGVSDLVIGLTIIALGTSLPELAACIAGALKGEHDIAIGNVIGSNIYNLLAVLSVPALLAPGALDPALLTRDMPVMIGLTLAMFLMGYGFGRQGRINRFEAFALVAAYVTYQGVIFVQTTGGIQ
jgi:cation:H+ antiporter